MNIGYAEHGTFFPVIIHNKKPLRTTGLQGLASRENGSRFSLPQTELIEPLSNKKPGSRIGLGGLAAPHRETAAGLSSKRM